MQRLLCVASLIAIVASVAVPVTCTSPKVTVFSSGNKTFSTAGVLRFLSATCPDPTDPTNIKQQIATIESSRLNLTEYNPSAQVLQTISPQESMLEWRPLTPVQSLYTMILIDASGTQASSLGDVSTILQQSVLTPLKKVHGETMVAMFDGSNIYWVKNFTTDHEDAIKTTTDKLNGYKIKDNSTNFWGALSKAQAALAERLDQVQLLDSKLNSEYAKGAIVMFSNGRDTCACVPQQRLSDDRIVAVSIAIGEDVDNVTMTSWFGGNTAYMADFSARKDQTDRNSVFATIFENLNNTIAYNSQGMMALRYCSPRRGSPLGDPLNLFQFDVSYNGISLSGRQRYTYNATTFAPGCTLNSAVSIRSITVLLFAALFVLSF